MTPLLRKKGINTIASWLISFLVIFILGGYIYFATRDYRAGPLIDIIEPRNYTSTSERIISIKGTTRHVSSIRLNGKPIFINTSGQFEEKLLLPDGYTIIRLEAEDRFGRHVEKKIELFKS